MAGPARQRPRNWLPATATPFGVALVISTLLHLSMVTLFQIVIWFPANELTYYDVRLVETPPIAAARAPASRDQLRGPDFMAGFEALGEEPFAPSLPRVELPTLEFAELDRLRVRRESGSERSRYRELFEDHPDDSWARFAGGLRRMGRTLTGAVTGAEPEAPPAARPAHRPAEGYEAFIDWGAGGSERALLFSPPIQALWGLPPADAPTPIEIVFEVNPLGRVVNAWSPVVDEAGVIDRVQMTVLQYRFEPLEAGATGNQLATLRIRPARDAR